jgi:hypothetical protein
MYVEMEYEGGVGSKPAFDDQKGKATGCSRLLCNPGEAERPWHPI